MKHNCPICGVEIDGVTIIPDSVGGFVWFYKPDEIDWSDGSGGINHYFCPECGDELGEEILKKWGIEEYL